MKRATILVVDDEPALRELLVDALRDEAVAVHAAASGSEALALARQERPDLVVTDLCLGDCSGVDVIDQLRESLGPLPAVVITGQGNAENLTDASRRRPLELMTKPLNLDRLRETVARELAQQAERETFPARTRRDRDWARDGRDEKLAAQLTREYRDLSGQIAVHQSIMRFQLDLIAAKTDDDVFRILFRTFVRNGGPAFGAALVCDADAQLHVIGRFGVPRPDSLEFCRLLAEPIVETTLSNPVIQTLEPIEQPDVYDESIRRFLPGVSILAVPLIPAPGEMIGLVLLYRKGEQPFTQDDLDLAEMIAYPTAAAVRRND
jgi:CheY-like chemotaxis protein